jgi:uncharacterized protein
MGKIEYIIKEVKKTTREIDFKYHILPVLNNALKLGKIYKADLEVIKVAAYLHDIAQPKDWKKFKSGNIHHIKGAKKARKILEKLKYKEDFIKKVEHCILAHRGRTEPNPETIEAKIINNADAMSHFDSFFWLFDIFMITDKDIEKSLKRIKIKLERNIKVKLTLPAAKKIVMPKYKAIIKLIDNTLMYS